jgi:hypothetical protein
MFGLPKVLGNDVGTATGSAGVSMTKIDARVSVDVIETRDWFERTLCLVESADEDVYIEFMESRSAYCIACQQMNVRLIHHIPLTLTGSILLQVRSPSPQSERKLTLGKFDNLILIGMKMENCVLAGRDQSKDLWNLLLGNDAGQR